MEDYNQNKSLVDNITSIYEYLYLPSLSDDILKTIRLYLEAYKQTLDQYNNSSSPSDSLANHLRILSGPIEFVKANFPDDSLDPEHHPAADIIKKEITTLGAQEKGFARTLRPTNIPNTVEPEIDYTQTNGFALAIVVLITTILLGIGLGSLLFFIK